MGQVVTDVQIVNGQIRVFFGPCCWHDIGSVADLQGGSSGDLPDDIWEQPGGSPTYSACGKANAVQAVVNKIIEASYSALGELPWNMVSYVQDEVGYDLANNWLVMLLANVQIGALGGEDYASIYDTIEQARIRNKLVSKFAADGAGVPTSDDFEDIKQIFKSEIWPLSKWQYWDQAINALGRANMDTAAKLGATDTTAECEDPFSIPVGATEPDVNGWFLSANLADQIVDNGVNSGWGVLYAYIEATEPVYGSFLVMRALPGGTVKRMNIDNAEGAYVADAFDKTLWGSTSDSIQNWNLAYPIISTLSDSIRTSLALQRGFAGNINGGSSGIDGVVIATPEGLTGDVIGARIDYQSTQTYPDTFEVLELRFVHNTNHP